MKSKEQGKVYTPNEKYERRRKGNMWNIYDDFLTIIVSIKKNTFIF